MKEPEQFDVVELLVDLPELSLQVGMQGAVVECYPDHSYDVEFTNSDGETLALVTLQLHQFVVVWRTETRTWVSVAEQIEALVERLTDDTQREVLNFTRLLYGRA